MCQCQKLFEKILKEGYIISCSIYNYYLQGNIINFIFQLQKETVKIILNLLIVVCNNYFSKLDILSAFVVHKWSSESCKLYGKTYQYDRSSRDSLF